MQGTREVKFWSTKGEHGYMSNFFKRELTFKDKIWKTSEHAYQAMKFDSETTQEYIRNQKSAWDAAQEGRREDLIMRDDWDDVKISVMYEVCAEKFKDSELRKKLLSTGDAILIEDSPYDYFWGIGRDGSGRNELGNVLMCIRHDIRNWKI